MGLSRYEQEVIINFNAEDETCILYTANQAWIRKMDKFVERNPKEFKLVDTSTMKGVIVSKRYEFPKKLVCVRSGSPCISDEERQRRAKRLKGDF